MKKKISSKYELSVLIISFKIILIFLSILCIKSQETFAEQKYDNPLGFSVQTIMPSTQIDQNKSFFYIKTEPNKQQKLKVKVTGTSTEPVKVKMYIANGGTSEEATINYIPKSKNDNTLKDSIEQITSIDQREVEVALDETKEVTLTIKPPNTNYEGIKLGAVYFEKVTKEDKKATVNSILSYRIGLVISENNNDYKQGEHLNFLKVQPELFRALKTIAITLQNPDSQVINHFSMNVEIINKKNKKIVKQQTLNNGSIAPNSSFLYSLNWGLDPIPSGTYIARIEASSDVKKWVMERDFIISEDKAKVMNEKTVFKLSLPEWLYVVTIVLTTSIIFLVIYILVRARRWKQFF